MTTPPITSPVLLTIRGTMSPKDLESARVLHNETAGSAPGIAAARALGDLSHNVFSPSTASKQSGAKTGELLFLDRWVEPRGIMEFFGNPHVQEQGSRLFTQKDPAVWMSAVGSYSYALPTPKARTSRWVGMVRGKIDAPEKAIAIFRAADEKAVRSARRRGLVSHEIFIKVNAPGDTSPLELLGLDVWSDFDGMTEHYADPNEMAALGGAFAGRPDASVWEQAPGDWSEW